MSWLESIGLKILELRGEILAGLFAACVFVLLLNNGDVRYARDLSQETLAWIFLGAVLTFFLIVARTGKAAFDVIKKKWNAHDERLRFLGLRALNLQRSTNNRSGFHSEESCVDTYRADIASLFIDLKKVGIDIPNSPGVVSAERILQEWVGYLSAVGKFLDNGHFEEAKALATHIVGEYEKQRAA